MKNQALISTTNFDHTNTTSSEFKIERVQFPSTWTHIAIISAIISTGLLAFSGFQLWCMILLFSTIGSIVYSFLRELSHISFDFNINEETMKEIHRELREVNH